MIFAPQNFEQHLTVETNTGVVTSYKLESLFPDLDPSMVKQFLVYTELCQRIEDNKTLKLIQGNEGICVDGDQSSRTPMESPKSFCYSCGWCIQCKPQQFLTTRFLQVLLLRLVSNYAAVIDEDSGTVEALALKRRCDVWKNGTRWCTRFGVEVLVEVTEQNSVVLILM